MDNMLEESKNLKDTSKDSIKDTPSASISLAPIWGDGSIHYNKINKLITALYMVTDTMDNDEPLRLQLRTLGVEILSDINSLPKGTFGNLKEKMTSILSFLNIAFDVGMISEMNFNIIRKEFVDLKQSIDNFTTQNHLWFEKFIQTPSEENKVQEESKPSISRFSVLNDKEFSKGHTSPNIQNNRSQTSTRIGVQKGSTLMRALHQVDHKENNFELIKQQRRESIIKIIKAKPEGVSIKDIILAIRDLGDQTGEKTIQRELVSMVKDNVLNKTGEKRWSLYFIVNK